ncbi:MAG: class I SAM-dependent methyltransferase, partial [Planctomycetota bacterium]|nr:class I SAM-dependent methyltransferase [Planctomycetota bacterium]
MQPLLPSQAKGLDFGSGPGPTLSLLMEESGYEVTLFDPFFAPDRSVLQVCYDFISCSETAEHFSDPRKEFDLFQKLLRPGGVLGVMTG